MLVVLELGEEDHLDEEAVRNRVKCLRDVHHGDDCSAGRLSLVVACKHPNRDREQGQGGEVSQFKALLRVASSQRLHDGREEKQLQDILFPAEQQNWAVGVALLLCRPCFEVWVYD